MIKQKFYEYESFGEKAKVVVEYSQYSDYGNTAVMLKDAEDGALWSVLSVNIKPLEEGCFAVDVNNCPTAVKFLIDNNIAKPLNSDIKSGYCVYPIFKLTSTEMKRYKEAISELEQW